MSARQGTVGGPAPFAEPVELSDDERAAAHMAASILLDYPDADRRAAFPAVASAVASLPAPIADAFAAFLEEAAPLPPTALEAHFTATFDLKRKCSPYLSYYSAGDTRRRGMALVRFIEAYRAAGWEVDADELPDYLPMVLEFSARSSSPIALELLAAHRDGIEVLRQALEGLGSPYAHLVRAVTLSLPEIDEQTLQHYRTLITEGPPAETVGLTFLGALKPFAPQGAASEEISA